MPRSIAALAVSAAVALFASAGTAHAAPPLMTKAFATSYAVQAVDANAAYFPLRLASSCSRKSRTRFICRMTWVDERGYRFGGNVRVWYESDAIGVTSWHYSIHASGRDRAGRLMVRLTVL